MIFLPSVWPVVASKKYCVIVKRAGRVANVIRDDNDISPCRFISSIKVGPEPSVDIQEVKKKPPIHDEDGHRDVDHVSQKTLDGRSSRIARKIHLANGKIGLPSSDLPKLCISRNPLIINWAWQPGWRELLYFVPRAPWHERFSLRLPQGWSGFVRSGDSCSPYRNLPHLQNCYSSSDCIETPTILE